DHPAAMRIGVDGFRLPLQHAVDLDDFAADRRVHLRDRLDRLDGSERLALLQRGPDFGQLDVYDVAELLLRIIGNSDLAAIARNVDPLVVFRIFVAAGLAHRALLYNGSATT